MTRPPSSAARPHDRSGTTVARLDEPSPRTVATGEGEPELVAAASAELERVVRALPQDTWDRPTPCGISVRELVEHVVVGNRFTALLLGGLDRTTARARAADDPLGDDPVDAVVKSCRLQSDAFRAARADQPVAGPAGVVTAAVFRAFRLVDLVVHGWDLLRAAGLDETLDEQVVRRVLETVRPHHEAMLALGAYGDGPSGDLGPDATPQARLLDGFGRRP